MNRHTEINLGDATGWRTPVNLLILMVAANAIAFSTWSALLNNFAIEGAAFTGKEIGILQSIREIPGFLAFTAVFMYFVWREQTFAVISLALCGLGTAITGFFPTALGFYITTFIMSVGFHYFETVQQSLSLQWLPKNEAPRQLGRIIAAGSFATIAAYALIFLTWKLLHLDFSSVYLAGGGATVLLAFLAWFGFPKFREAVPQRKHLLMRKRYWLYYALTFMSGARRQIFIVFAGFMMVEKFGFSVAAITGLFLANAVFNMWIAPKIGNLIIKLGERRILVLEYVGLIGVFLAYAFVENPWIAAALYLVDHAFFAMAIAQKTYFQKIADPADMAPTAGVAFTINHIAAVVIPVLFGLIWLTHPSWVFIIGAAMAGVSLALSLLIPRDPREGNETLLSGPASAAAAPAE
ncbi:MFS transporter [Anderseniella sp. Alg231-50]|uniref:MFS transporter n=1 Tax=Anderseniella sp. Alg231-50 TaxID=1922226 RepID=UPI000D55346B